MQRQCSPRNLHPNRRAFACSVLSSSIAEGSQEPKANMRSFSPTGLLAAGKRWQAAWHNDSFFASFQEKKHTWQQLRLAEPIGLYQRHTKAVMRNKMFKNVILYGFSCSPWCQIMNPLLILMFVSSASFEATWCEGVPTPCYNHRVN